MYKKVILVIFILSLALAGGLFFKSKDVENLPTDIPKRVTMEGEIVCLPNKNTKGPQTLECAYGIKTNDGNYYSLDTYPMSATPPKYNVGDRIKANGVLVPIEQISTDTWDKYNIKGIFSATDSLEIL